jgi:hypothetical protein
MKKLLFLCLAFIVSSLSAQADLSGIIINKETREPLAFVNIIINHNTKTGVITDIDGMFTIKQNEKINTITCSYLGFETKTLQISGHNYLRISLSPKEDQLEEVILSAKNPAHAIIEKVIAKREENNPNNIKSFQYTSYNKTIFDYVATDKKTDSVMNSVFKGGHLTVMESVTQKKFIAPNLSEETVIGNKVSGFKNPYFATLATDMQPFSFYDENIKLLEIPFLNPISNGALKKYEFRLTETLYKGEDKIHLISFQPIPNKNFEGLKGVLYINTNNYALQNVIAEPANGLKMDLKIQQQYQFLENKYWFPEQLNYELQVHTVSEDGDILKVNGKSYINEVDFNSEIKKKEFSALSVKIEEQAAKRDSLFWTQYRVDPLRNREAITYQVMDSLGEKYKFDRILSYMEKLPQGRIPVKFIDIDLSKTFIYNQFEGYRLGTGLYTNEKLFKDTSLGGFFGYGLQDNRWKYGLEAKHIINRENEFFIKTSHQNNVKEIGSYGLPKSNQIFGGLRDFMASKMDHLQQYKVETGFRIFKYLKVNVSGQQDKISPLRNYGFETPELIPNDYQHTAASVRLRYAFREKLVQTPHQNVSLGTSYPVFTLNYTKGFDNILEGELDYQKIEFRAEQDFFLRNFGETSYRLQAGYINKVLPNGLMFTGEGSYDPDILFLIENTFQTQTPYEFLSQEYVDLFLSHNFGSLLFKKGDFNPEIIIHHNFGWGNLDDHTLNFKTKKNIYLEAGLQLGRLVKINYFNMGYFSLNAGAFYRYGAYHLDSFDDNFAFKIGLGFSFN